ncbi:MAG: alpha-L-rhamnosidase C-terminal domain-containing protein [Cyclobacteriaceae bacterium]
MPLVNQIIHCVQFVQRGNMHSAPTDCPQRTERFGWLGDMQAFAQTSMYNMDMAGFLTKWVADIRDSQLEDGRFPNLAPHPSDLDWLRWYNAEYGPAWSDAGIIIPWLTYLNYGDKRILEQQYEAAVRWVKFIHERNPDLIWRNSRGGDYGDWLNGSMTGLKEYPRESSEVAKDLFATAFFAHSTDLLSRMANVLGFTRDATRYAALYKEIKSEFNREFVLSDGRVKGNTQAGYALVLNLNLVSKDLRSKVTGYLLEAIQNYKGHLSTGMQTTHRMMLELTRNGHHDEAWRLINLRSAPSWGHMVEMGATTIWERWDGFKSDSTFQSPNMNSFNHMAFGAVGEWVWKSVVGINVDDEHPGFKHFIIKPGVIKQSAWVKGEFETIRGTIVSHWKQQNDKFEIEIQIPANTTATLYIPTSEFKTVKEGGRSVKRVGGIDFMGMQDDYAVFRVGSGDYSFESVL